MTEPYYVVPDERRYWVVRADGGNYLPHFEAGGVVAIGHLDDALRTLPEETPQSVNWATIHERLLRARREDFRKSRGIGSLISQAKVFVNELKVGDWVICPSSAMLRIGVVTGDAYWGQDDVAIHRVDNSVSAMSYKLRRSVSWGPAVYRDDFSSPLQRSLLANQTVFNVDSHWEAICHTIYPAFARNDALFLSAKITSKGRISNVDVASFLLILSDIEVIVRSLSSGLTTVNFDETLEQLANDGELNLATKAEFYSPGDIWVQLFGGLQGLAPGTSWMAGVVFAYSMLFGNKLMGFDGLLDLDTRHKIRDLMLDRMAKRRASSAVEHMSVRLPEKNVLPLESEDKKLKN